MKRFEKHIKKVMFGLILLILFVPMSLSLFPVVEELPLIGAVEELKSIRLNKKTWFNGNFQRYCEDFARQNFGLRPNFVRFDNEIRYGLFKKINAPNIYEGKESYLFRFYIKSHRYTTSFRGTNEIKEKLRKLSEITEILDNKGTTVIFAVVPAKNYFCRDKLPEINKIDMDSDSTNYKCLINIAESYGVNLLDLNQYFEDNRGSIDYPIFSKGGIHWTTLASFQGMREILEYGSELSDKQIPQIRWSTPFSVRNPVDSDLVPVLNQNRGWDELDLKGAYLLPDSSDTRPSVLIISDSFFNSPYWSSLHEKYFAKDFKYWYYYTTENDYMRNSRPVNKANLMNEIQDRDYIIIMSSIMNLGNIGYGFIEDLHENLATNPESR